MRKADIRTLRKQLAACKITVYKQSGQWIQSVYNPHTGFHHVTPMHYTVKTERQAIQIAMEKTSQNPDKTIILKIY